MVAGCDTSRSNTGSDESSTGTDGASTPTFTASNITVSCSYFADDSGDYGRTVVKGSLRHDGKTSVGTKITLEAKTAEGAVLDRGTFVVPYNADGGSYIGPGETAKIPEPIIFFNDYSLKCASSPTYVLTVTSIYSTDQPAGKIINNQQVYP